jgi:hypothetical protein
MLTLQTMITTVEAEVRNGSSQRRHCWNCYRLDCSHECHRGAEAANLGDNSWMPRLSDRPSRAVVKSECSIDCAAGTVTDAICCAHSQSY